MLKGILKFDVAPRGPLLVWSNLQRGMCILNLLLTLASQVAEYQRTEQKYRDMAGMRTFADAQRKSKGKPQMPTDKYETFKKNITTYEMYLLMLFVDECHHYQGIWAIRRMLAHREGNMTHFKAKYRREITWAIIIDSCHFFHQQLMPIDYTEQIIDWPISLLDYIVQDIRR